MNIKALFSALIMLASIVAMIMVSCCIEEADDIETNSEEVLDKVSNIHVPRTVSYGENGELFSTPNGILLKNGKIVVDKVIITMENIHDEPIHVNTVGVDISFDDDISTTKHYEATMNTDMGIGETKSISIHIHQFSEWEKPHLVSVEVV